MPKQVASCTPTEMKLMLEIDGWVVAEEDEFHWRFRDEAEANRLRLPIILPKQGDYVEIPILNQIIYEITGWGMVGYFELRKKYAPF